MIFLLLLGAIHVGLDAEIITCELCHIKSSILPADSFYCEACHDGITAKQVGTETHPVSIFLKPEIITSAITAGLRVYDGKMECLTCHSAHQTSYPALLRVSENELCKACHADKY